MPPEDPQADKPQRRRTTAMSATKIADPFTSQASADEKLAASSPVEDGGSFARGVDWTVEEEAAAKRK
jgi:hypothetical protein